MPSSGLVRPWAHTCSPYTHSHKMLVSRKHFCVRIEENTVGWIGLFITLIMRLATGACHGCVPMAMHQAVCSARWNKCQFHLTSSTLKTNELCRWPAPQLCEHRSSSLGPETQLLLLSPVLFYQRGTHRAEATFQRHQVSKPRCQDSAQAGIPRLCEEEGGGGRAFLKKAGGQCGVKLGRTSCDL